MTDLGVEPIFIEKGRPQQNGFVERFNGLMRNELLNAEEFGSLLEAKVLIDEWRQTYNTKRPHGALGHLAPLDYARRWKAQARESIDA